MSARFEIIKTPIDGLSLLQRKPIADHRGYLERLFCSEELEFIMPGRNIVQINHTLTATPGTLRGMHFQNPPHAEIKLVTCLRGDVFDVAVDMRRGSPTLLHWHAEILSGNNHRTLVIPEGFAHGFQTLTDNCEMLYLHTAPFRPDSEGGLNAQDPRLAIAWPLPAAEMSVRDSNHPFISTDFAGLGI